MFNFFFFSLTHIFGLKRVFLSPDCDCKNSDLYWWLVFGLIFLFLFSETQGRRSALLQFFSCFSIFSLIFFPQKLSLNSEFFLSWRKCLLMAWVNYVLRVGHCFMNNDSSLMIWMMTWFGIRLTTQEWIHLRCFISFFRPRNETGGFLFISKWIGRVWISMIFCILTKGGKNSLHLLFW